MSEVEREIWVSLDRRLADHEMKIANVGRDYTELKNEIRQLMERINMGVSPTQNKILEKQSNIEKQISDFDHKWEKSILKMETSVQGAVQGMNDHLELFDKNNIAPLNSRLRRLENVLFYSLIGGALMFVVNLGLGSIKDRFFKKEISGPPAITAIPMKR